MFLLIDVTDLSEAPTQQFQIMYSHKHTIINPTGFVVKLIANSKENGILTVFNYFDLNVNTLAHLHCCHLTLSIDCIPKDQQLFFKMSVLDPYFKKHKIVNGTYKG